MKQLYLGVDGGATKCIVRLEDEGGQLLGTGRGGSANIRLSVDDTWHSIEHALAEALAPLQLSLGEAAPYIRAGMGLAGCEIQEALTAFLEKAPAFQELKVTSDAHTACLGAHAGQDGAIIIAGTGVVGYQIDRGEVSRVSGWGFPHDDEGGGAWLGLKALKLTLRWKDGRGMPSALVEAIDAHFYHDLSAMVNWANQATPTALATLAPLVIREAKAGDQAALQCLCEAGNHINAVSAALISKQSADADPLPCVLVGSIAPHLIPYLNEATKARLVEGQHAPEVGAILWMRSQAA